MADIYRSDIVRVDLDNALLRKHVGSILVTGDKQGNRFGAEVYRDGKPVDISDCGVVGYYMRPGEDTIILPGATSGSVAYVDLEQACYSKASSFTLTIKISGSGAVSALRVIDGYILLTQTDELVDPGEAVPTLDDIFAQIAAMERATKDANLAVDYVSHIEGMEIPPIDWEQGNLTNSGEANNSKVIRTVGMTPWGDAVVLRSYVADGYVLSYYQYTADGTLIIVSGVGRYNSPVKHADAMYYRLKLEKSPSAAIVPEEGHEAAQVFAIAPTKEAPITPITMGAVADGVADDTEAFQAAVNAGCDVFVPTSNGQKYRITSTITIPSTCRRIYSEGVPRGTATVGAVIFDLTGNGGSVSSNRNIPMFRIGDDTEAFSMYGFTVKCNAQEGSRVGLFMDASTVKLVDKDITINSMTITNFYRMFNVWGRGFTVINSGLTSSNHIASFAWDDASDSNNNHPSEMNHRGIMFKNNRLHSITGSFFTFTSGHAYGFTMIGNTADVGRGVIIDSTDEAWNWLIEGNVFQGMHCHTVGGNSNGAAIQLKGGARNCIISNNAFSADPLFWDADTGDGKIPDGYIDINGTATGCNIVGNNFRNCYKDCIDIQDANGVIINSNIFDGVGSTDGAAVTVVGGRLVSIMGNVSVTLPVGGFDNVSGVTGSSIDKNLYMS